MYMQVNFDTSKQKHFGQFRTHVYSYNNYFKVNIDL